MSNTFNTFTSEYFMLNDKPVYKAIFLFVFFILSISLTSHAGEFPSSTAHELRFGAIVPTTGRCEMSHETGIFTSDYKNICPSSPGRPLKHIILAPKNTLIKITPHTFIYPGGVFIFTPTGVVKSATETVTLLDDNPSVIDSGDSGRLEIIVAGVLDVYVALTPGSSLPVELLVDITLNNP
jgi:hypothetical protein